MIKRLVLIVPLVLSLLSLLACEESVAVKPAAADFNENALIVYKNPQCNCCGKWVEHISDFGFSTQVENTRNLKAIKSNYGIAPRYQSCHTAIAPNGGYVFEGHIPAYIIERFLAEKPENTIGLAVPGMPVGSPGMERGDQFDAYDVLLLKTDGSSEVYEHIAGPNGESQGASREGGPL